jgi:hypothetical protein
MIKVLLTAHYINRRVTRSASVIAERTPAMCLSFFCCWRILVVDASDFISSIRSFTLAIVPVFQYNQRLIALKIGSK